MQRSQSSKKSSSFSININGASVGSYASTSTHSPTTQRGEEISRELERTRPKNVFATFKELVHGPQRLRSVLLLCLVAAIGSVCTGMTLRYSSPAGLSISNVLALSNENSIGKTSWTVWAQSVFGVRSYLLRPFFLLFSTSLHAFVATVQSQYSRCVTLT